MGGSIQPTIAATRHGRASIKNASGAPKSVVRPPARRFPSGMPPAYMSDDDFRNRLFRACGINWLHTSLLQRMPIRAWLFRCGGEIFPCQGCNRFIKDDHSSHSLRWRRTGRAARNCVSSSPLRWVRRRCMFAR
mgnify:CR=1 FL=1